MATKKEILRQLTSCGNDCADKKYRVAGVLTNFDLARLDGNLCVDNNGLFTLGGWNRIIEGLNGTQCEPRADGRCPRIVGLSDRIPEEV